MALSVAPLDLLPPAQALAGRRVEVVPLAAYLLPAHLGPAVNVKVALSSVGVPRYPTGLHDAGAVEVVPVSADLLAPPHWLPVIAVVVGLAADDLPRIARGCDIERNCPASRVVLACSPDRHRRPSGLGILPIRHLVVRPRFQNAAIMRYHHIRANRRTRILVRSLDARHRNRF